MVAVVGVVVVVSIFVVVVVVASVVDIKVLIYVHSKKEMSS